MCPFYDWFGVDAVQALHWSTLVHTASFCEYIIMTVFSDFKAGKCMAPSPGPICSTQMNPHTMNRIIKGGGVPDYSRMEFDVKFKISESENDDNGVEVKAHKFLLGAYSPVFRTMFYGEPWKERADPIIVKGTTVVAFKLMLNFVYNVDVVVQGMDLRELFELGRLADLYLIDEMKMQVNRQMEIWPVTMDNMTEVFAIASEYKYFESASNALKWNCAKSYRDDIVIDAKSPLKWSKWKRARIGLDMYMKQQQARGHSTEAMVELVGMVKELLVCDNCRQEVCLMLERVTREKIQVGLKVTPAAHVAHMGREWKQGVPYTVAGVDGNDWIIIENCDDHERTKVLFSTMLYNCV